MSFGQAMGRPARAAAAALFFTLLAAGGAGAQSLPYWHDARFSESKRYWEESLAPERIDPYWRKALAEGPAAGEPYWADAMKKARKKAYWEAKEKEQSHLTRLEVGVAEAGDRAFPDAPAEKPRPAAEEAVLITCYAFKDDRGVTHLSDRPQDARYYPVQLLVASAAPRYIQERGGLANVDYESLRPYIIEAALAENLDPALVAAVIKSESAFDPKAKSWAGAQGLMQLIPSTAALVGCLDPFDPLDNIKGGTRYLRMMLDQFGGDLSLALAAYNAGPQRVARNWAVPDIRETRNYVRVVLENYKRYQPHFGEGGQYSPGE